jgi:hypothetical protein
MAGHADGAPDDSCLLHVGLTPDEVSTLVKGNPSQLLDRD